MDLPRGPPGRGRVLDALVPRLLGLTSLVVENPLRLAGVLLRLLERLPERLVEDRALVLLALHGGGEEVFGALLAPRVLPRRLLERTELRLRDRGLVREHGAGLGIDFQRGPAVGAKDEELVAHGRGIILFA